MTEGETRRDPLKGLIFALIGTVLLGTNFITVKYSLGGFRTETFSFIWSAAAATYALLIVVGSGKAKRLAVPRKLFLPLLVLGSVSGCAMIFGWSGLRLIDPSFSSFIWRSAPVLAITAGAVLFKEKLSFQELLAVVLMLAGSAVSTIGRWDIVGWGFLLTIAATVFTAIQSILAKRYVAEIDTDILVFYRLALATPVTLAWMVLNGNVDFSVPARFWIVACLGAFLGPCFSFVFTFRAYKYWELSRAAMVQIIQPLLVIPLAYVFLHQFPSIRELIGGMFILAGGLWISLLQLSRRSQKDRRRADLSPGVPDES